MLSAGGLRHQVAIYALVTAREAGQCSILHNMGCIAKSTSTPKGVE